MFQNTKVKTDFAKAENNKRDEVKGGKNRLAYHLMPPVGWLNDPNGLYEKDGTTHIFYQYAPQSADGSTKKGWGHYATKDFLIFTEEDIPVYPDSAIDAYGAYSGSAFIDGDTVHFFYTGNGKLDGDYDFINEGRLHYTNHFTTKDGSNFSEKEVLMKNEDYPADLSCHVRDPKVILDGDTYFMVQGARTRDSKGLIQIFESKDLIHWKPSSRIYTNDDFGYMWECPDVFDLDGTRFLITCPQGVETKGIDYESIYNNGYFKINHDLSKDQEVEGFTELDRGFDFYAPQTYEDEKGRRILIGWMGLPDTDYTNPTLKNEGWQHALTLPRLLTEKDGHIYQYPIEETLKLRATEIPFDLKKDQAAKLPSRICELQLHPETDDWILSLRKDVVLSKKDDIVELSLKESGCGRTSRHVKIDHVDSISIFSDVSSLEIFLNKGEEAFTTRVYDSDSDLLILSNEDMTGTCWKLRSYEIIKKVERESAEYEEV